MTELEQKLYREVQEDHDYIVGLRRWFHQHPELAREENLTAERIEQELDALGIAHRRVAVTGVMQRLRGQNPVRERSAASSCAPTSTAFRSRRQTASRTRASAPEKCTPADTTPTTRP